MPETINFRFSLRHGTGEPRVSDLKQNEPFIYYDQGKYYFGIRIGEVFSKVEVDSRTCGTVLTPFPETQTLPQTGVIDNIRLKIKYAGNTKPNYYKRVNNVNIPIITSDNLYEPFLYGPVSVNGEFNYYLCFALPNLEYDSQGTTQVTQREYRCYYVNFKTNSTQSINILENNDVELNRIYFRHGNNLPSIDQINLYEPFIFRSGTYPYENYILGIKVENNFVGIYLEHSASNALNNW